MPWKSQAQRRLFYAKLGKGEVDEKTIKEYEKETKGKDLPEHISKIKQMLKKNKK